MILQTSDTEPRKSIAERGNLLGLPQAAAVALLSDGLLLPALAAALAGSTPGGPGGPEGLEERGRERGSWEDKEKERLDKPKPRDRDWEQRVRERERERELAWQEIAEEKDLLERQRQAKAKQAAKATATTLPGQTASMAAGQTATTRVASGLTTAMQPQQSSSASGQTSSPKPPHSTVQMDAMQTTPQPQGTPQTTTTTSTPSLGQATQPGLQDGERPREDVRGQGAAHDLASSPVMQAAVEAGENGRVQLHAGEPIRRLHD